MMTDPFFGLMALWQLGEGYRVWNITATTEFVRPGRGLVRVTMLMPPEDMAEIRANLEADGVSRTNHSAELVGADGELVARTSQELYVRRHSRQCSAARPAASATARHNVPLRRVARDTARGSARHALRPSSRARRVSGARATRPSLDNSAQRRGSRLGNRPRDRAQRGGVQLPLLPVERHVDERIPVYRNQTRR